MRFWVSLDQSISVLLAFVAFGLVSSVPSQVIGWEERLRSDLFCVEWALNECTQTLDLTWVWCMCVCSCYRVFRQRWWVPHPDYRPSSSVHRRWQNLSARPQSRQVPPLPLLPWHRLLEPASLWVQWCQTSLLLHSSRCSAFPRYSTVVLNCEWKLMN